MYSRAPSSTRFPYTTLFRFFFNDTATTEIYTLSLHDALPISERRRDASFRHRPEGAHRLCQRCLHPRQRLRGRSEEHTSELQSHSDLVCRLLLEIGRAHV